MRTQMVYNQTMYYDTTIPSFCRMIFLVWFWLLFNVPVNNFSVMLGLSHCFLGIYQYFGELKVSCSRTLHGGRGVRTLDLSLGSQTLYH